MTPSKLKEQLMQRVPWSPAPNAEAHLPAAFYESLIDIILEQQRALEDIRIRISGCAMTSFPIIIRELDGSISMERPLSNEGHAYNKAKVVLASTSAKLKALGCE